MDRAKEGDLEPSQAKALGIEPGYHDYRGDWREVPVATLEHIAAVLSRSGPVADDLHPIVITQGDEAPAFAEPVMLTLEDGTSLEGLTQLPPDLPFGYHTVVDGRGARRLIACPRTCFLPPALRVWGWAVQLYSLRSRRSWGMGDVRDLAHLGEVAAADGARVVLLNPLHASAPVSPIQGSPYYPTSRCFRDPLYLCVESIPEVRGTPGLDEAVAHGRALSASDRVDRDRVFEAKMRVLERAWESFAGDASFDAFVDDIGGSLLGFATFCALAEAHGGDTTLWPAGVTDPASPGVAAFRAANWERVRFHMWLQWLLDRQLEDASKKIGVIHDLAIGVDPRGADAWLMGDSFAPDVSIGAPPDDYNTEGQDWGIAGFDPAGLSAAGYEPLGAMLRATMRHGAGIRIDHVMGMFRLFWIPSGATPAEGAYVRYPARDLLAILALESHRASAFVIGEDLGTVEEGVRGAMQERAMLGYRLLWFLDDDAKQLPYLAMSSGNTHDLPTTAGLWSGTDLEEERASGMAPDPEFRVKVEDRIQRHLGVDRAAEVGEVIDATARLLANADSAIVTMALEDAVEGTSRYNRPGTTGKDNWTATLPLPLEEVVDSDGFKRISAIMHEGRP